MATPATLAWIAQAARSLAATQQTKQATDTEIGQWANEGLARLYDELVLSDDSYYTTDFDFTVSSGTEAAATAALPADFYKLRAVTRWPDTTNACPVYAQPYTNRNYGAPGYVLKGTGIMITPWGYASMAGNYRVSYAPHPPRFGRALDLEPNLADGIVSGSPVGTTWALQCAAGLFSEDDGASSLILFNAKNSLANLILAYPNGLPLQWTGTPAAPNSTATLIGTTASTNMTGETFTANTFAMVCKSDELYQLDTLCDPFRQFIVCYVANKILEKKKQPNEGVTAMMQDELARVQRSAPIREAEPEAAPLLWAPRSWRRRFDGCDGSW